MKQVFEFEEDEHGYMQTCFVLCSSADDRCKELVGPFTIEEAQSWDALHRSDSCHHEFVYPIVKYSLQLRRLI